MHCLVVIGNGMAGARTVEEILARGGGKRFQITMFGEEPYGNYNRILLSEVLSCTQDALNPFDWHEKNAITLHAGVRVAAIDRWAKQVSADDGTATSYDKLLIATGSRPFIPPSKERPTATPGPCGPGSSRCAPSTTAMP